MPFRLSLFALLLLATGSASGQDLWTDAPVSALDAESRNLPAAFRALTLDRPAMERLLASGAAVPLAMPDGKTARFRVREASILAPGLQARYPQLRTYTGVHLDDPRTTVRMSLTPSGLAAWIQGPEGTALIDPVGASGEAHLAYMRRDAKAPDGWAAARDAEVFEAPEADLFRASDAAEALGGGNGFSHGETLHTYRLAIATTGEYAQFHGGTKETALEAIVVAMARVNGIYERDLAITMVLVENNEKVVFTDSETDPYTDNSPNALISENQAVLDDSLGADAYDIGHVFSTGGGGVAGFGVVCREGSKARGVTGLRSPIGDPFYVDYVAHEMGHQFQGSHTFNGNRNSCGGGNRSAGTAYEPGSGSTIMAYAGICGLDNIQSFSNPYFHTGSLRQIASYVSFGTGSTCGTTEETGNLPPVVVTSDTVFVPRETPFFLAGAATDETPEALTYTWEEIDRGSAGAPPGRPEFSGNPPLFRSFLPVSTPTRTFPERRRLLAGLAPVRGEALPINTQRLQFRLTARDNREGAGAFTDVKTIVAVDTLAGPFVVTAPEGEGLMFDAGAQIAVTWDVASTDIGGIVFPGDPPLDDEDVVDVATVDILFSSDDGATFEPLALATPNDGMHMVTLPDVITTDARILVQAAPRPFGSTFFDVNDSAFSVGVDVATAPSASGAATLRGPWPNPVRGDAWIEVTVSSPEAAVVALYDALGRHVRTLYEGPLAPGTAQRLQIRTGGLAAGMYVVRMVGAETRLSRTLSVVR